MSVFIFAESSRSITRLYKNGGGFFCFDKNFSKSIARNFLAGANRRSAKKRFFRYSLVGLDHDAHPAKTERNLHEWRFRRAPSCTEKKCIGALRRFSKNRETRSRNQEEFFPARLCRSSSLAKSKMDEHRRKFFTLRIQNFARDDFFCRGCPDIPLKTKNRF